MPGKNCSRTVSQQELDRMFVEALLTGKVLKWNGVVLEDVKVPIRQPSG